MDKDQQARTMSLRSGVSTSVKNEPSSPDVKEQIINYFSEISGNLLFQWSARKLQRRYDFGCRQVEDYVAVCSKDGRFTGGFLNA